MVIKHYSGHDKITDKKEHKEHLKKRSGQRNVNSSFQIQLEKDAGSSTGQNRMQFVSYVPPAATKS